MDRRDGLARSAGTPGKTIRLARALVLAAVAGAGMAHLRSPTWGLLAFVMFGLMFGIGAISMSWVRRWSAEHVVADASLIVPFLFLALLLIPVLPWWMAALIALAAGAVIVPLMVHRRKAANAPTVSPTNG
jgi:Na+-translocating ferredoxin:NAD+ oxidoreductase RnfD subunit